MHCISLQKLLAKNIPELVAHEMGHALRLNHVSDPNALMRDKGYKGDEYPSQDDVDGVNSNYK